MDSVNINPQDIIFALDIGTRSVIGTVGIVRDKKFCVVSEYSMEHEERAMIDGQIHDVSLVASAVNMVKKQLEEKLKIKLEKVAIAAAGRFLRTVTVKAELKIEDDKEIDKDIVRSLELTAVKTAEKQINNQASGKLYCVGYSVKNYYLNGYVISNLLAQKGETIEVEVIATFLPRSVVDSLYSVMNKVGLEVISLTLEPIAAIEAAIPKNLRLLNLALVDIGAGTSDIAISSKESISAYGMVPLAGDEVTELIAQNYLLDFNTAEKVKRQCTACETIKYTDVLGLENEISSEEIIKLITPIVKKIAEEIGSRIIDLNGSKSTNAVFLVGGGAHTPLLREFLAEKLAIAPERIAIRGRDVVTDCVCEDNSLGSTGVTVLGIALVSIKRLGHDFIDVILNGNVVSLFNSHKHTVMDAMMQAGVNPKVLVGKNGKNIRFMLNGIKRLAFGTLATNAEIRVNNRLCSIDEEVKEGDKIEITYAMDGKDASPKVLDYVKRLYSISFFMNDIIENLEPIGIINGERITFNDKIKENDDVKIIFPKTLDDYKQYFMQEPDEHIYYINGKVIKGDYIIQDGDRIYKLKREEGHASSINEQGITTKNHKGETDANTEKNLDSSSYKEIAASETSNSVDSKAETNNINSNKDKRLHENAADNDEIHITVNGEKLTLKGKKEYIFVDIFNHVKFDLSVSKGSLYLHLNNSNAGYYDKLKEGDIVELGWK
ncbi:cell division protein FtsA [Clostridium sp. DJ247]|uniref:cell division protein FtsA n=1 Tax=Clostridium sp. DJ247 TaxID=2726188 RepID=UPI001626B2EC|nr:cell division protein FtsA [Clostridium sp. DJ247]MBC2580110.1 cell division protein FtsA [Clostridium sp. DJ247]